MLACSLCVVASATSAGIPAESKPQVDCRALVWRTDAAVSWGMSRDDVARLFPATHGDTQYVYDRAYWALSEWTQQPEVQQEFDAWYFADEVVFGRAVIVAFAFLDSRLAAVAALLPYEADVLGSWLQLEGTLTAAHGHPKARRVRCRQKSCSNEILRREPEAVGEALQKGYVGVRSEWERSSTRVRLESSLGSSYLVFETADLSCVSPANGEAK